MKKTFVLMTIVLALLAAPVFAEVSISGDIDFGFSSDFAAPEDVGDDNKVGFVYDVDDLDLDILATVDEFTTVEFSINWDQAIIDGSDTGVIPGAFTAKTDVTGAFGIDSAADVTLITGYNDYFETMDYATVSRIEVENIADHAIAKTVVIGADVTVNDMFTVSVGMCPAIQASEGLDVTVTDLAGAKTTVTTAADANAMGMAPPMFFGAYTTMDALSAEVYFNMNRTADYTMAGVGSISGVPVNSFGFTANYAMPMDFADFTFGAALNMDMVNEDVIDMDSITTFAVAANAVMGAFDASIGMATTLEYENVDTAMALAIDAGYQVNETVLVYGGVTFDDLLGDDLWLTNGSADEGSSATGGMEVGAKIMAGACQYYVGYQTGTGDIYNRTDKEGMFFRLQADY